MTLPTLRRSSDRKVTNAVSPNGKTARLANSFGLPSGKAFSCPGATSVCEKVCYAGKLEKIYAGVRNVLLDNWNALNGASLTDMVDMLQNMINDFSTDCDAEDKRRAKRGENPVNRAFRIHWDGDFFSRTYAEAWATVIAANPEIQFWVYTRSFAGPVNVMDIFDAIPRDNLGFYLSVDAANRDAARAVRSEYPWANFAELAETFAEGRDALIAESRKTYDCPENGKRIPLISEKGSACIRCNICVKGRGDVIFSIKKR